MTDATIIGGFVTAVATLLGILFTTRTTARGQSTTSAIDGLDRLVKNLEIRMNRLEEEATTLRTENRRLTGVLQRVVHLATDTVDDLLTYIARWAPKDAPPPPVVPGELRTLLDGYLDGKAEQGND